MSEERKPGLQTRSIHSPPARRAVGVPVVGPIVPAATYAFDSAAEFGRVMSEEEYGFLYARLRNPTVEDLNAVLASLEGAEAAQAFSSGMAAISAALVTALEAGDTLLCARQLYGNTYSFIEKHLPRLGIEVVYLDVTDLECVGAHGASPLRRDDRQSGRSGRRPPRARRAEGRRRSHR